MVERLFLAVPRGCLQFVIVVFPDHTHLLFLLSTLSSCEEITRDLVLCAYAKRSASKVGVSLWRVCGMMRCKGASLYVGIRV